MPKQQTWGEWLLISGHGLLGLESRQEDLVVVVPHYLGSLFLIQGRTNRCLFADGSLVEVPANCLPHLPAHPEPTETLQSPDPAENLSWTLSGSHFRVVQQLTGLSLEIERYGQTVRLQHARLGDVVVTAVGVQPYSGPAPARPTPPAPPTLPVAAPVPVDHWSQRIDDEAVRRVLMHLEKFGAVTEHEVEEFTGSPRQARAFSNKLDQYRALLPFAVDLDTRSGQKTYRKK